MTASLYDRPDLYDLMVPSDPAMEAFYVTTAQRRGGRVLDLACGTGRFTIPIARTGLEVVGGDLSPGMLERARQSAAAAGVGVEFRQLDMRDFTLEGRFDTVIIATNSILHLETHDDFRGLFASVERHLAPEGRLVFDAFVPNLALLSRLPGERHVMTTRGTGRDEVVIEETMRYDPARQLNHIEWIWSRPGDRDFWRHPLVMRQIFPQEMPLLVGLGGLRLLERYGDFSRAPFGPDSPRQVCVCGR